MGKDEAIIFRIVIPNKGRPAAPVLRDYIAGIDLGQVFYGNFSKRAQLRDGCKDVIAGKGRLQAIFRGNAGMVPPVVKKRIFSFRCGAGYPGFLGRGEMPHSPHFPK